MTNLIVANGRYQGGGMLIAPEALADDGLFDVLVIGDITKRDFVLNVGKIYRGTHLSHPKIELLRSASVSVDAEVPVPIELDGEQPGTTPARFEVVPAALRLRVP
jgi:diacylglycerol kinase (ATP)